MRDEKWQIKKAKMRENAKLFYEKHKTKILLKK